MFLKIYIFHNKNELKKNKIVKMSPDEYNNFSRSNGMVSNMSEDDSSSSEEEDEYDYRDEFKEYLDREDPQTTRINLLNLINNFVQETGFRIQNVYTLTQEQLQQYRLPQYNFVQDLTTAYGYVRGTEQYTDLVTKMALFARNQLIFNDYINGIDININILNDLITRRQRIPIPNFFDKMWSIEDKFELMFEEEPRTELNYENPYIPGIETHTIPNSEFTDIDFRYCEFVSVKYFFLPEGNIPTQHPNIIKYQMNIIENSINKLLNKISFFYPDERPFFRDIKDVRTYRLTYPVILQNENIDISYYYEYLQLYMLMAMYRYLVTYNGVHIRRLDFLDYIYQIEALLHTNNIQLQRAMVSNYINFLKLKYLEQNPNN